jgi:hypothetical protein
MKKRTIREEYISLETAKLAKEKGFANGTRASYCHYLGSYVYDGDPEHNESYKKDDVKLDYDFYTVNNMEGLDYSNEHYSIYEAPKQSLLQRWLREEHNMEVFIIPDIHFIGKKQINHYRCWIPDNPGRKDMKISFDTYEEALEAGLLETLELI